MAFNNNSDCDCGQIIREFFDAINRVGNDVHVAVMKSECHDVWSEPLTQGDVLLRALAPYLLGAKAKTTPLTPRIWIIIIYYPARI